MTQDACSFGQRDGKDCGSYPTCKKQGAAGTTTNNNRGQGKRIFLLTFYRHELWWQFFFICVWDLLKDLWVVGKSHMCCF